jgi:hypothetical protein
MEQAEAPDDAYQLGSDPATGTRDECPDHDDPGIDVVSLGWVAIGIQRAVIGRLALIYGQGAVIFVTPDEIAVMMASSGDAASFVGTVKRLFPGAVVE